MKKRPIDMATTNNNTINKNTINAAIQAIRLGLEYANEELKECKETSHLSRKHKIWETQVREDINQMAIAVNNLTIESATIEFNMSQNETRTKSEL